MKRFGAAARRGFFLAAVVVFAGCRTPAHRIDTCTVDDPRVALFKVVKGRDRATAEKHINALYPRRCGLTGSVYSPKPGGMGGSYEKVLAFLRAQTQSPTLDMNGYGWIILDNVSVQETPELDAALTDLRREHVEVFFLRY